MYEYHVTEHTLSVDDLTKTLNRLAGDGWRVVGTIRYSVILEHEVVECRHDKTTGELVPCE